MTAIEKLKHLKYILNWNLNLKSMDILPTINEVIADLEDFYKNLLNIKYQDPAAQDIMDEVKELVFGKTIYNIEYIKSWKITPESIEELSKEKTIEELRKEYTEKFSKKPFGWWYRDVLISKLK